MPQNVQFARGAQMKSPKIQENELITFLRKRDYLFVRELGQGACGKTVLLYDDQIQQHFVCKKYQPHSEAQREILFSNFTREIKLLHRILHPNIVRVFNYYLYPEILAGYILMEFIDGSDIENFAQTHPEQTNELFVQAVTGFAYLEHVGILHRDIRPGNLLVNSEGQLKIIDLGFGKSVRATVDFEKSINLNWWCTPPREFGESRYDFGTEVYFVGKLFEQVIQQNGISHFKFTDALGRMCQHDPSARTQSFVDVERSIQSNQFFEIDFDDEGLQAYRDFAAEVAQHITKLENGTKYVEDTDRIQAQLNEAYRRLMLEEYVPDSAIILRCLVVGTYYYKKGGFPTRYVREFVRLLKTSTAEQTRIIIANLHTKLNAIPRYSQLEAEVPF
jgi:serine/threonine protein kinase